MRESASGRVFSVFVHTVLIIIALTCILPFLHLIALSISEGQAVDLGQVLFWPVGLDFTAYKYFFQNTPALRAFGNSVIITLGGTALSMLTTVLTAYPLSRRYLYARKPLTTAALFTMLFSGGMIPTYLVMNNLHLTNTYWSLWFVGLISTYNMLIMKSFFENIPSEVTESAQIDGCGETHLLLRIILPLSLPMLAGHIDVILRRWLLEHVHECHSLHQSDGTAESHGHCPEHAADSDGLPAKKIIRSSKPSGLSKRNIWTNADWLRWRRHVHLNPSYFSNLFKKETGESVTGYIQNLRVQKAKILLKSTDMKIFEIAQAIGFNDSNYFTHMFNKIAGLSPKEYRKRTAEPPQCDFDVGLTLAMRLSASSLFPEIYRN